jgi:hypothetical protein
MGSRYRPLDPVGQQLRHDDHDDHNHHDDHDDHQHHRRTHHDRRTWTVDDFHDHDDPLSSAHDDHHHDPDAPDNHDHRRSLWLRLSELLRNQ